MLPWRLLGLLKLRRSWSIRFLSIGGSSILILAAIYRRIHELLLRFLVGSGYRSRWVPVGCIRRLLGHVVSLINRRVMLS